MVALIFFERLIELQLHCVEVAISKFRFEGELLVFNGPIFAILGEYVVQLRNGVVHFGFVVQRDLQLLLAFLLFLYMKCCKLILCSLPVA